MQNRKICQTSDIYAIHIHIYTYIHIHTNIQTNINHLLLCRMQNLGFLKSFRDGRTNRRKALGRSGKGAEVKGHTLYLCSFTST